MAENYDLGPDTYTEGADSTASDQSITPAMTNSNVEVDPKREALVNQWCKRVKSSKSANEKTFKRMTTCMKLAKQGAEDEWVLNDKNYTAPVLVRHINQAVAQLYAKNPRAEAKRRHRLMNTVWDGTLASLTQARQTLQQQAAQQAAVAQQAQAQGMPPPPPQAPDPNAQAIVNDAENVRQYNIMIDGLAKTMELLWQYFMDEQSAGYKQLLKAMVRRTKVCAVSYVQLDFQRALDPEVSAQIDDVTSKIAAIQAAQKELAEGDIDMDSAEVEQLRLNLQDLQDQPNLIVSEGPVLDFPGAAEIIVDKKCKNLKTFFRADWIAREFNYSADEIQEKYKIDIAGSGAAYTEPKYMTDGGDTDKKSSEKSSYKVWQIQDKKNRQFLTVCDGYKDFLCEPATPDVQIRRFWTIFPLVFNEVESDDDIYPLSDVWLARHPQREYNRSRESLREHRIQNRPKYISPAGMILDEDKTKLKNAESGSLIELQGLQPGQDAKTVLQPMAQHPIDPKLYDAELIYQDILRTVGSQEANLGQPGNQTATGESIAENSRSAALSDNVDDLDDMLSELAQAAGELMLQQLSKETVVEIVGPGAVWPDVPATRDEISKDLLLDIKAGSSGRPNRAAELANLERGMPFILQLPGINPTPLAEKYTDLLEVDLEDAVIEGLPSITAFNNRMASLTTAAAGPTAGQGPQGTPGATGPLSDPAAQGPAGALNAPVAANPAQPIQPAMPTPAPGVAR
jgi:hypothetical protein